jgi:catechol 2,3-dioxygenase-like lactoylglutathione lyase family enzyme
VSIGTNDMVKAKAFYQAVMEPLGCQLLHELKDDVGGDVSLGWGKNFPELWVNLPLEGPANPSNGAHFAFFAPHKNSVDAFYRAALERGGSDAGAPGYRSAYQPGYYAAFVRDPDGNKIEAVWFDEKKRT